MRCFHHSACRSLAGFGHAASASRGICHSSQALLERGVKLLAQRLERLLEFFPDDVDFGVVGDGFQRDVRDALIDEALTEIAVHRHGGGNGASDLGFFELAVAAIGEQVIRIACAHETRASESECDAGSIDGDPAAAPLFGDVGGCAGAAGGIEYEVAGVGGHEDATLDNRPARLHDIDLCVCKLDRVVP